MATSEGAQLQQAARRAYEWGRAKHALRLAWVVLPLACIAFVLGAAPEALVCLTILLLGIGAWLRWRGGVFGAAVLPGVLAGILPLAAAPLAARSCSSPIQAALALGVVATISGAALAASAERRGAGALFISLAVALATTCLSCVSNGAMMVGSALGLATGAVAFVLIRRSGDTTPR